MPRVLAVPHPQHVEDVGLAAAEPLLLLGRPRHQVVSGPQHQVGLQVAHYLLPKHGHIYVVSEEVVWWICKKTESWQYCYLELSIEARLDKYPVKQKAP